MVLLTGFRSLVFMFLNVDAMVEVGGVMVRAACVPFMVPVGTGSGNCVSGSSSNFSSSSC